MGCGNYANLRVTDIPTVQRLFPPKPATLDKEVAMQSLKDKLLRKVLEFKEKRCNEKGWLKEKNISKGQSDGLKEIGDKIKNKEIVVFTTDKSSRFTADSPSNYKNALNDHIKDDVIVNKKTVKQIETKMNQHLSHFNKMFKVGSNWKHEDRVACASTATNVPPPPKYGLRKDHKTVPAGREQFGPQLRAIVGARDAPNSRFGHFLSKIVGHFSDSEDDI